MNSYGPRRTWRRSLAGGGGGSAAFRPDISEVTGSVAGRPTVRPRLAESIDDGRR